MKLTPENDSLIQILGIDDLPASERLEILNRATDLVQTRVFLRIMKALPEEKHDLFNSLVESLDEVGISGLLGEHKIDTDKIIEEEVAGVKRDHVDLARVV